MSKVFLIVFLIFGTVVGSGFSSGKEIMVFFSRFGVLSYLYILLAGFLFFLLFYFFLSCGDVFSKLLNKFKWLNFVTIFISIVFCSSMFAGIKSLLFYFPAWLYYILIAVLLVVCVFVTFKGINGLEKINLFLMPTASIIFVAVLIYGLTVSSDFSFSTNSWAGFLYSPLYVALNTSMSGFIISKAGGSLNKKQTFLASLFSTLLLLTFLLLGNFVLQRNSESFVSDMPFLYIVRDNPVFFTLAYFMIFAGCFTTLISLCFTLKTSFENIFKNKYVCNFSAVFLPFLISGLGFSQIISLLYPICSVLGILILLFSISSFKQTDEIIHSKGQDAKDGS